MKRFTVLMIIIMCLCCIYSCDKSAVTDDEFQNSLTRQTINNNIMMISSFIKTDNVLYFSAHNNTDSTSVTRYNPEHNIYSVFSDKISAPMGFFIWDNRIYYRDPNVESRDDLLYQSCDLNGMDVRSYYFDPRGLACGSQKKKRNICFEKSGRLL